MILNKTIVKELKEELLDAWNTREDSLHEIEHYKKAFPMVPDYNIYMYGNIRPAYYQIRDFFEKCNYDTSKIEDTDLCEIYKKYIRVAVDEILKENR